MGRSLKVICPLKKVNSRGELLPTKNNDNVIPAPLAAKGIDQATWDLWFGEKLMPVLELRWHNDRFFPTPGLRMIIRKWDDDAFPKMEIIRKWDEGLRKWQNDFNAEVLSKHGVFVKTQSVMKMVTSKPGVQPKPNWERWLAFSLTDSDRVELQGEPHLYGILRGSSKPCEYSESALCVHY